MEENKSVQYAMGSFFLFLLGFILFVLFMLLPGGEPTEVSGGRWVIAYLALFSFVAGVYYLRGVYWLRGTTGRRDDSRQGQTQEADREKSQEIGMYCVYCGSLIRIRDPKFCPNCGARLKTGTQGTTRER